MSLRGALNDEKNHSRKISFEIKCIIEWWSEFSCRLYFTLITFLIIISKNTANESFGCVYYPNIFSVWKKLCSNSIPGKVVILGLLMSECSGDWSDIPTCGVKYLNINQKWPKYWYYANYAPHVVKLSHLPACRHMTRIIYFWIP